MLTQGARHLLAYGSYGGRHLLQTYGSYGGRHLLQAYSVQQFMAETIGLKYSLGNRRRLLDASPPAAGTYKTVTLPGATSISLYHTCPHAVIMTLHRFTPVCIS